VLPILTWPSPATTTSLFFLTSTIVVNDNKVTIYIASSVDTMWLLFYYLQGINLIPDDVNILTNNEKSFN
jgi:hypothetical protein